MLEGVGLTKDYVLGLTRVRALTDVNISIAKGEFVALVGPSGSGKTTLIHILGLIERPSAGTVFLDGKNVSDSPWPYRGRRVSIVFQFFNLLPGLTALENVALPLIVRGVNARYANATAAQALVQVGLEKAANKRPIELSGGEQQRVAIARALASGADYILADEPTGNLDSENGRRIAELLRQLSEQGKGVLVATHNLEVASMADRVVRLKDGMAIGG